MARPSEFRRYFERFGPDRVIEILHDWVTAQRLLRIDEVLEHRIESLTVAVVGLYDPHNGAAMIRTCEAMGLCDVHAADEQGAPLAVSKKVALGGHKWLSIHRHPSFEALRAELKTRGFSLWAAVPSSPIESTINSVGRDESVAEYRGHSLLVPVVDVQDVSVQGPLALLFGNERDGLPAEVVERCDGVFSLPMWGFTASYNLSVSVGMALQVIVPRFRRTLGQNGDLCPETKRDLRAQWLFSMVRAAPQILDRAALDGEDGPKGGMNESRTKGTDDQ